MNQERAGKKCPRPFLTITGEDEWEENERRKERWYWGRI
jgi:hypothetical protein